MQNQAERKKRWYETLKKVKQDIRDNIFNLQHQLCSYKMTQHKPPKVTLKNNSRVYIDTCKYIYILVVLEQNSECVFGKTRKSQFGKFLKNTIIEMLTSNVSDLSFSRIYFSNNFTTDSLLNLQTNDLPRSLIKITVIVISLFKVDQLHKYSETKKNISSFNLLAANLSQLE